MLPAGSDMDDFLLVGHMAAEVRSNGHDRVIENDIELLRKLLSPLQNLVRLRREGWLFLRQQNNCLGFDKFFTVTLAMVILPATEVVLAMLEAMVILRVATKVLEDATTVVVAFMITWLACLVAFVNLLHCGALPLTHFHGTLRVVLELGLDPVNREAWARLQAVRLVRTFAGLITFLDRWKLLTRLNDGFPRLGALLMTTAVISALLAACVSFMAIKAMVAKTMMSKDTPTFVVALVVAWLAFLVACMDLLYFRALFLTLHHCMIRVLVKFSLDPIHREVWARLQAALVLRSFACIETFLDCWEFLTRFD